ncbi:MAG: hypothetical protein R2726_17105 [Acidimicrobiales bacterium]
MSGRHRWIAPVVAFTLVVGVVATAFGRPDPAEAATPPASQYTPTVLPGLIAGGRCTLDAVTADGTMVGDAVDASSQAVAVVRPPGATSFTALGVPAGMDSVNPTGANALGDLVGDATSTSPPPFGSQIAVVYQGGTWVNVNATVGPPQAIIVRAVNDSRIAVGSAEGFVAGLPSPIRWDLVADSWQIVPGMAAIGGQAADINDAGQIAGSRLTAPQRAFFYDPASNTTTDSPTLGGATAGAMAISSDGFVAGDSATAGGATHPFLWDPATNQMTDLGLPPGATGAVAIDVNSSHQVVGFFDTAGGEGGAFLWDPVNGMQVLAPPTGTIGPYAAAINDAGLIVGSALNPSDEVPQCAVWTPPAPPPTTSSTVPAPPTSAVTPAVVTPSFTG